MADLQATIDVQVELSKFYNVDLFQRGYYQLHTSLKTPAKAPIKVEVSLPKNSECHLVFPASIINGVAISKTFQILYRSEDIPLDDVILFKVHMLVDSQKIVETLNSAGLELGVELWFTDEEFGAASSSVPEQQEKLQCISSRSIKLHFNPTKGLHHHMPVLFDYFHLSAICVTVHATLLALHQPYMNLSKLPKSAWTSKTDHATLETVLFTSPNRPASSSSSRPSFAASINSTNRLENACQMHRTICNILLSAYESLQSSLEMMRTKVPTDSKQNIEHIDCHAKLETLTEVLSSFKNEEDLLQTATTHIAQLCAENMLLWAQYIETVTLNEQVTYLIAKEHHTQRTKRFGEAFFTYDYPKQAMLACFETSIHGHTELASQVRNSDYLSLLQPLSLDCAELDGEQVTLPIIFEDVYCEPTVDKQFVVRDTADDVLNTSIATPNSKNSSKNSDTSSNNSSSPVTRRQNKRKLIDIRPPNFRRPLSYVEGNNARGSVAIDQPVCTLVGYRKVNVENPATPVTELGTLSTEAEVKMSEIYAKKLLASAVSMPSLQSNTLDKRIINSGSMPELFKSEPLLEVNSRSSNICSTSLQEHIIHEHNDSTNSTRSMSLTGTSDARSIKSDSGSKRSLSLTGDSGVADSSDVKISVTAPDAESEKSSPCSTPDLNKTSDVNNDSSNENCDDLKSDENNDDQSDKSISNKDSVTSEAKDCETSTETKVLNTDTPVSVPQLDNGVDYNTLVESISDALGEVENEDLEAQQKDTLDEVENKTSDIKTEALDKTSTPDDTKGTDQKNISTPTKAAEQSDSQTDAPKSDTHSEASKLESQSKVSNSDSKTGDASTLPNNNTEDSRLINDTSNTTKISDSKSNVITTQPLKIPANLTESNRKQMSINEWLREEYEESQEEEKNISTTNNKSTTKIGVSLIGAGCLNSMGGPKIVASAGGVKNTGGSSKKKDVGKNKVVLDHQGNMLTTAASSPNLTVTNHKQAKLVSPVSDNMISFITAKENLRQQLRYNGLLYSDFPTQASVLPYFWPVEPAKSSEGIHLIICVHGLDGNSADLRLVRTYLEMALCGERIDFLMSEKNQGDTFADLDVMTDRLVSEIFYHIDMYGLKPSRVSFIGHSLGNLIIRSALCKPQMATLLPKLYTFLSLSGPHLGTLYNNSGLVNMGMWVMQKWKKSGSLLQLSLKDHSDPRQSFLYKLSQKQGLEFFRNVILVGSSQDRYVPFHSSRIELCKSAQRDNGGMGSVYAEMVSNILQPIVYKSDIRFVRYDVFHALNNTANNLIGRAAHIAVLDSELFIEKFVLVAILKYFK